MVKDKHPTLEVKEKEEDTEEIVQPEENNHDNVNEEMECVEDEEYSNDFSGCFEEDVYATIGLKALEDQLEHLQSALDHLERKNDHIHAELTELLQSNREARKQFQESLQTEEQQSK